MFRRRDEEESDFANQPKTNIPANAPINVLAQPPANAQAATTGFGGFNVKKEEPPKQNIYSQPNTPAAKPETPASEQQPQSQAQPQNQPQTVNKPMSFTEVTPKQTTYKLTPSGAFTNQDAPTAPTANNANAPVTASKPAAAPAVANLTPRFDNIEAERRLTVGYGISLEGKVSDCDKLIIYGRVKAELNNVKTLHISESGKFTGSASIEYAEISGIFEGEIRVTKNIIINSTGRVNGKITYGSIEIKPGGKFTGEIIEDKTLSENNSSWQNEETTVASENKAA